MRINKTFAELKARCKTKSQMRAFNALIKTFGAEDTFTPAYEYTYVDPSDYDKDELPKFDSIDDALYDVAKSLGCNYNDLKVFYSSDREPNQVNLDAFSNDSDGNDEFTKVIGKPMGDDKNIYLDGSNEVGAHMVQTDKGFKYAYINTDSHMGGAQFYVAGPDFFTKDVVKFAKKNGKKANVKPTAKSNPPKPKNVNIKSNKSPKAKSDTSKSNLTKAQAIKAAHEQAKKIFGKSYDKKVTDDTINGIFNSHKDLDPNACLSIFINGLHPNYRHKSDDD